MSAILLRPTEVAELLGISRSKVFELLSSEELPTVRFGRVVRVPRDELEDWIRDRTRHRPLRRGLLGRLQSPGSATVH